MKEESFQSAEPETCAPHAPGGDLWVFGYGSLMWRPGFPYVERCPALLRGYHRAMCIRSARYRGTAEQPGLVLGLDRGGSCRGIAFRAAAADAVAVIDYLHEREMISGVYQPKFLNVALDDGRRVRAYGFVADRGHRQYAGALAWAEKIALVREGYGISGSARDYLATTVEHLDALGITDGPLHRLLADVDSAAL